jgi:glycosyltransferase involved in cell wall biosynthesis
MRILIHSNAPQVPSGYGRQTALLLHQLQRLGHEPAVSAFVGVSGAPMEWQGFPVFPSGQYDFGIDTIVPHSLHYAADLTIALMDFWKLGAVAEQLAEIPLAAWLPVDCTPLSFLDAETLRRSKARPIAMSPHGAEQLLADATWPAHYIPHAVDTDVYKPLPAQLREDFRRGMEINDRFVIGICAANNDQIRKGWPEQFEAFRRFHKTHDDALLLVHTIPRCGRGLDLQSLAHHIGIPEGAIRFSDTYAQISGIFDDEMMADWYSVLDVLSSCSYAEAFCVPLIEAQACGTPVVVTNGSAMADFKGAGWAVQSQPFWNHVHGAWWDRPDIPSIVKGYEKAYAYASSRREKAREFAVNFDAEMVADQFWKPFIDSLASTPVS